MSSLGFAERLYEALEPVAHEDAALGYPLRTYCRALARTFAEVEGYGGDTEGALEDPADYTLLTGTMPVIRRGRLNPANTSLVRLLYANSYPVENHRAAIRVRTSDVTATWSAGVLVKMLDGTNYLRAKVSNAGTLLLEAVNAGTAATLTSVTVTLPNTGGELWLYADIDGDTLTCEYFTADPAGNQAPTGSLIYALTGANKTKFGAGILGQAGFELQPKATSWRVTEFSVDPWTPGVNRAGWAVLTDVDSAPREALPWLAQFSGVRVPSGTTQADARRRIKDADGTRRGTPAALVKAVQRTLTGNKTVVLTERDGSAYRLGVFTYVSETPDSAATQRAILDQKPAGIVLNYVAGTGAEYSALDASHTTYAAMDTAFTDYNDQRTP